MSSTFKRCIASNSQVLQQLEGTKPTTTSGVTFTSTGLRDLDQVLSGGQPLTTCLWLEEDRWTCSLARCLVQYWCAEGLSQNQFVVIPVEPNEDKNHCLGPISWCPDETEKLPVPSSPVSSLREVKEMLDSLPRNLNKDKDKKRQQVSAEETAEVPLETLEEAEEDDDETADPSDEGLTIAWQYKASVQRERMGHNSTSRTSAPRSSPSTNVYCHSYDLQGRLSNQMDTEQNMLLPEIRFRCPTCTQSRQCCGFSYFNKLKDQLQSLPASQVQHGAPVACLIHSDQEAPCGCNGCCPAVDGIYLANVTPSCKRFCSRFGIVCVSSTISASPEFRRFHGLLHIVKSAYKRPTSNIYGLKRDRRKLFIELLHIPPEDYAAGGGSTGSGVRSGAGRPSSGGVGCSSSGGALDF